MLKNAKDAHEWLPNRIAVPFLLASFVLFAFVPGALATSSERNQSLSRVGPKKYYLALGDSLAFGYQPNLDFNHGYVDDFYSNLQNHGVTSLANMACPGETSKTFINGGCPYPYLRKYPYIGSQLTAAITYLRMFSGQVSPVTLDIGANDILPNINTSTCKVNNTRFHTDLKNLDMNLTRTILPKLKAALTVNKHVTGDIVIMKYYDPYQNICPKTVSYVQTLNSHLASDISGFGIIVNVFRAFGGSKTPNKNICTYTWMCSIFADFHSTDKGYSVIATTFENGYGY